MRIALRLVLCLGIALFLPWLVLGQYGGSSQYSPVLPPSDDPYYTPPDIPHPLVQEKKPELIRYPQISQPGQIPLSGPQIHGLPSPITSSQSTSKIAPPIDKKFYEPKKYQVPIKFTIRNLGQNANIPGYNNNGGGGSAFGSSTGSLFREQSSGSVASLGVSGGVVMGGGSYGPMAISPQGSSGQVNVPGSTAAVEATDAYNSGGSVAGGTYSSSSSSSSSFAANSASSSSSSSNSISTGYESGGPAPAQPSAPAVPPPGNTGYESSSASSGSYSNQATSNTGSESGYSSPQSAAVLSPAAPATAPAAPAPPAPAPKTEIAVPASSHEIEYEEESYGPEATGGSGTPPASARMEKYGPQAPVETNNKDGGGYQTGPTAPVLPQPPSPQPNLDKYAPVVGTPDAVVGTPADQYEKDLTGATQTKTESSYKTSSSASSNAYEKTVLTSEKSYATGPSAPTSNPSPPAPVQTPSDGYPTDSQPAPPPSVPVNNKPKSSYTGTPSAPSKPITNDGYEENSSLPAAGKPSTQPTAPKQTETSYPTAPEQPTPNVAPTETHVESEKSYPTVPERPNTEIGIPPGPAYSKGSSSAQSQTKPSTQIPSVPAQPNALHKTENPYPTAPEHEEEEIEYEEEPAHPHEQTQTGSSNTKQQPNTHPSGQAHVVPAPQPNAPHKGEPPYPTAPEHPTVANGIQPGQGSSNAKPLLPSAHTGIPAPQPNAPQHGETPYPTAPEQPAISIGIPPGRSGSSYAKPLPSAPTGAQPTAPQTEYEEGPEVSHVPTATGSSSNDKPQPKPGSSGSAYPAPSVTHSNALPHAPNSVTAPQQHSGSAPLSSVSHPSGSALPSVSNAPQPSERPYSTLPEPEYEEEEIPHIPLQSGSSTAKPSLKSGSSGSAYPALSAPHPQPAPEQVPAHESKSRVPSEAAPLPSVPTLPNAPRPFDRPYSIAPELSKTNFETEIPHIPPEIGSTPRSGSSAYPAPSFPLPNALSPAPEQGSARAPSEPTSLTSKPASVPVPSEPAYPTPSVLPQPQLNGTSETPQPHGSEHALPQPQTHIKRVNTPPARVPFTLAPMPSKTVPSGFAHPISNVPSYPQPQPYKTSEHPLPYAPERMPEHPNPPLANPLRVPFAPAPLPSSVSVPAQPPSKPSPLPHVTAPSLPSVVPSKPNFSRPKFPEGSPETLDYSEEPNIPTGSTSSLPPTPALFVAAAFVASTASSKTASFSSTSQKPLEYQLKSSETPKSTPEFFFFTSSPLTRAYSWLQTSENNGYTEKETIKTTQIYEKKSLNPNHGDLSYGTSKNSSKIAPAAIFRPPGSTPASKHIISNEISTVDDVSTTSTTIPKIKESTQKSTNYEISSSSISTTPTNQQTPKTTSLYSSPPSINPSTLYHTYETKKITPPPVFRPPENLYSQQQITKSPSPSPPAVLPPSSPGRPSNGYSPKVAPPSARPPGHGHGLSYPESTHTEQDHIEYENSKIQTVFHKNVVNLTYLIPPAPPLVQIPNGYKKTRLEGANLTENNNQELRETSTAYSTTKISSPNDVAISYGSEKLNSAAYKSDLNHESGYSTTENPNSVYAQQNLTTTTAYKSINFYSTTLSTHPQPHGIAAAEAYEKDLNFHPPPTPWVLKTTRVTYENKASGQNFGVFDSKNILKNTSEIKISSFSTTTATNLKEGNGYANFGKEKYADFGNNSEKSIPGSNLAESYEKELFGNNQITTTTTSNPRSPSSSQTPEVHLAEKIFKVEYSNVTKGAGKSTNPMNQTISGATSAENYEDNLLEPDKKSLKHESTQTTTSTPNTNLSVPRSKEPTAEFLAIALAPGKSRNYSYRMTISGSTAAENYENDLLGGRGQDSQPKNFTPNSSPLPPKAKEPTAKFLEIALAPGKTANYLDRKTISGSIDAENYEKDLLIQTPTIGSISSSATPIPGVLAAKNYENDLLIHASNNTGSTTPTTQTPSSRVYDAQNYEKNLTGHHPSVPIARGTTPMVRTSTSSTTTISNVVKNHSIPYAPTARGLTPSSSTTKPLFVQKIDEAYNNFVDVAIIPKKIYNIIEVRKAKIYGDAGYEKPLAPTARGPTTTPSMPTQKITTQTPKLFVPTARGPTTPRSLIEKLLLARGYANVDKISTKSYNTDAYPGTYSIWASTRLPADEHNEQFLNLPPPSRYSGLPSPYNSKSPPSGDVDAKPMKKPVFSSYPKVKIEFPESKLEYEVPMAARYLSTPTSSPSTTTFSASTTQKLSNSYEDISGKMTNVQIINQLWPEAVKDAKTPTENDIYDDALEDISKTTTSREYDIKNTTQQEYTTTKSYPTQRISAEAYNEGFANSFKANPYTTPKYGLDTRNPYYSTPYVPQAGIYAWNEKQYNKIIRQNLTAPISDSISTYKKSTNTPKPPGTVPYWYTPTLGYSKVTQPPLVFKKFEQELLNALHGQYEVRANTPKPYAKSQNFISAAEKSNEIGYEKVVKNMIKPPNLVAAVPILSENSLQNTENDYETKRGDQKVESGYGYDIKSEEEVPKIISSSGEPTTEEPENPQAIEVLPSENATEDYGNDIEPLTITIQPSLLYKSTTTESTLLDTVGPTTKNHVFPSRTTIKLPEIVEPKSTLGYLPEIVKPKVPIDSYSINSHENFTTEVPLRVKLLQTDDKFSQELISLLPQTPISQSPIPNLPEIVTPKSTLNCKDPENCIYDEILTIPEQVDPEQVKQVEVGTLYDDEPETSYTTTLAPQKSKLTLKKCKFNVTTKKCLFDEDPPGQATSYLGNIYDGEINDEEAIREVLELAQKLGHEYLDLRSPGGRPASADEAQPPATEIGSPSSYEKFEPEIFEIGPVGPVGREGNPAPAPPAQPHPQFGLPPPPSTGSGYRIPTVPRPSPPNPLSNRPYLTATPKAAPLPVPSPTRPEQPYVQPPPAPKVKPPPEEPEYEIIEEYVPARSEEETPPPVKPAPTGGVPAPSRIGTSEPKPEQPYVQPPPPPTAPTTSSSRVPAPSGSSSSYVAPPPEQPIPAPAPGRPAPAPAPTSRLGTYAPQPPKPEQPLPSVPSIPAPGPSQPPVVPRPSGGPHAVPPETGEPIPARAQIPSEPALPPPPAPIFPEGKPYVPLPPQPPSHALPRIPPTKLNEILPEVPYITAPPTPIAPIPGPAPAPGRPVPLPQSPKTAPKSPKLTPIDKVPSSPEEEVEYIYYEDEKEDEKYKTKKPAPSAPVPGPPTAPSQPKAQIPGGNIQERPYPTAPQPQPQPSRPPPSISIPVPSPSAPPPEKTGVPAVPAHAPFAPTAPIPSGDIHERPYPTASQSLSGRPPPSVSVPEPSSGSPSPIAPPTEKTEVPAVPAPSAPAPAPAPSAPIPGGDIHEGSYPGPPQPINPPPSLPSIPVPQRVPAPSPVVPPSSGTHEASYKGTGPENGIDSKNPEPNSFPIAKNPLNSNGGEGNPNEIEEYGPVPDIRIPSKKITTEEPTIYEETVYEDETSENKRNNITFPLVDNDSGKLGQETDIKDITYPVAGPAPAPQRPAPIQPSVGPSKEAPYPTASLPPGVPPLPPPNPTGVSHEDEIPIIDLSKPETHVPEVTPKYEVIEEEEQPAAYKTGPGTVSGGGTQIGGGNSGPEIESEEVVFVPEGEETTQHRSEGPRPVQVPSIPAPSGSYSSIPAPRPQPIHVEPAALPAPQQPQPYQPQPYQPQPPPLHVTGQQVGGSYVGGGGGQVGGNSYASNGNYGQVAGGGGGVGGVGGGGYASSLASGGYATGSTGGGGGYANGGRGGNGGCNGNSCGGGGGGIGCNLCGGSGNSCSGGSCNSGGYRNNNNGCCGGNWLSQSGGFCNPINFNPCAGNVYGGGGGFGGGCGPSGCSSQRSFLGSPCPPPPSCPVIITISCAQGCSACASSGPSLPPPPCLPGCSCPSPCPPPIQQCCCPNQFNCGRGGCLAMLASRKKN